MALPTPDIMWNALIDRDASFEGVFFTAVRTTGIFCRPTCTARKPLRKNVEFYSSARDALFSGYRPCLRCKPMALPGEAPEWVNQLIHQVDDEPTRRWRDSDLRDMDLSPARVRRWFLQHHGLTFHAYARSRRLGIAIKHITAGNSVTRTAFDHGYESLSGFGDAVTKLAGSSPASIEHAPITVSRIPTPLGPMVAASHEGRLCLLEFADRRMLEVQMRRIRKRYSAVVVQGATETIRETQQQLAAYFEGDLSVFDLPLGAAGTPFQEAVWEALRRIPHGSTTSYGAIARSIGRPTAVRAVARANGDNRLAIIIPCHRVVGADGALTGYGGGLWRKRRLIDLEQGLPSGSNAE